MFKALADLVWQWIEAKKLPPGARIVLGLIAILGFIIVSTFALIMKIENQEALNSAMSLVHSLFTGVLAITACAVSFYMASERPH